MHRSQDDCRKPAQVSTPLHILAGSKRLSLWGQQERGVQRCHEWCCSGRVGTCLAPFPGCSPEKAAKFVQEVKMYVWEEEVDGR